MNIQIINKMIICIIDHGRKGVFFWSKLYVNAKLSRLVYVAAEILLIL